MKDVVVRFAPSPTGKVHIGNMRVAIFNYVFARHNKGRFLLRVEDTDLVRSTRESINALYDCMKWLGLDYDDEVMYQTEQREHHLECLKEMWKRGYIYGCDLNKKDLNFPAYFEIPYNCDDFDFVREVGFVKEKFEGDIKLNKSEITFICDGKEEKGALAGYKDLRIYNKQDKEIFYLKDVNELSSESFVEVGAISYIRREVCFKDMVRGEMHKSLDKMSNFVIARSDGSPVFHLANVVDDITQGVTHIIRGDDHIENTYKHLFLFHALGVKIPEYLHLPMIVNQEGKPYSKRDGDAYVGDFRDKGFLSESLLNYLMMIGYSCQGKMSREELIKTFDLKKVQKSAGQFDLMKLEKLNSKYLKEDDNIYQKIIDFDCSYSIYDGNYCKNVFEKMRGRFKTLLDVKKECEYYFNEDYEKDFVFKESCHLSEIKHVLKRFTMELEEGIYKTSSDIETLIRMLENAFNLDKYRLNQPIRYCISGRKEGISVQDTILLLGKDRVIERIKKEL